MEVGEEGGEESKKQREEREKLMANKHNIQYIT
jgi:hypothetical protein